MIIEIGRDYIDTRDGNKCKLIYRDELGVLVRYTEYSSLFVDEAYFCSKWKEFVEPQEFEFEATCISRSPRPLGNELIELITPALGGYLITKKFKVTMKEIV